MKTSALQLLMKAQEPLEPVERNPVAIRNTVLILIGLMLLGGFFIVYKYKQKMGGEYEEVKKGRPSMTLGNIRTNFQVEGPEGKVYEDGFTFLENKVSLMTVISPQMERESLILIDILSQAAERYQDNESFQVVCISADPYEELSADELKAFSVKHGGRDSWIYITCKSSEFSKYVNKNLKLGDVTQVKKGTDIRILPDITRLVDYNMNMRGRHDDYYFVARKDAEAESGKKNLVSEWQKYMYKNIDYVLNNESVDTDFSERNNSNRYFFPLIVFGGFVAFILIMGYRLKRQRRQEELELKNKK